jgi:hypothetical protein
MIPLLLAATHDVSEKLPPPPPGSGKIPSFFFSDLGVICLVVSILGLALFSWVAFIRGAKAQGPARRIYKSSHSHSRRGSSSSSSSSERTDGEVETDDEEEDDADEGEEEEESEETATASLEGAKGVRERRRKKRRTRRRHHRSRNPTLSQVGGLPPPRDPKQPTSHIG